MHAVTLRTFADFVVVLGYHPLVLAAEQGVDLCQLVEQALMLAQKSGCLLGAEGVQMSVQAFRLHTP